MNVVDTGDKFTPLINIDSRISSQIFEKKIETVLMGSGAQGTMIN
jgi:hypothetical protein